MYTIKHKQSRHSYTTKLTNGSGMMGWLVGHQIEVQSDVKNENIEQLATIDSCNKKNPIDNIK